MYGKADKIPNKGPSTNDFTNGYKQKLDSLKNYDDTSIKKEISNIKTEQVTQNNNISNLQKENEELKEENKHLKEDLNGLPSGTVSGENIDITDSAEMRFSEFNVRGNSRQESNLYNGELERGSINDEGEVDATNRVRTTKYTEIKESTKITINADGIEQYALVFYNTNYELITISSFVDLGIETEMVANARYIKAILKKSDNSDINVTDIANFVIGNTPSPDYPSEVESCGDNVNLLNISSNNETVIRILDDEATISYDNEVVKVTRNVINHSNAQTGIFYAFKTEKGKEYTVSPVFSSVGTANVRVYKDNTNTTGLSGNITSGDSYTFIAEQGQYWLRFWISANFVGNSILYAKVVEGRDAKKYSSYGQGCINEVICNRNELCSGWEQGAINIDTGIDVGANNAIRTSDFIRVMPNVEYYISRTIATLYNTYCFYDINKNFIGTQNAEGMFTSSLNTKNMQANNYEQVFTINNVQVAYMKIFDVSNNLNTKYLLQRNTIVDKDYISSEFQTHTIPTQQPFRAIENTRDTFIKKNNKWYERHYSSRYVFTGNEEWRKHESIKNNAYYLNPLSNPIKDMMKKPTNNKEALPLYSNRFIYKSTEDIAFSNIEGISISVLGDIYIGTTLSGISSLDELKTYLQQNKTYFDFLLQTPTDIECTEEQNKILDKIENEAKTYKNITHVYSIDKVSSNAEITYKKDLETLFSNALTKEV